MSYKLPLISKKRGAVCSDVRPMLREVFRDTHCLPPLTVDHPLELAERVGPDDEHWAKKFSAECKEISDWENELKHEHARRLARGPCPNIYKLNPPRAPWKVPDWKVSRGIIQRRDLKPAINQDAGRDTKLWVKNILNRSSCNFCDSLCIQPSCLHRPVKLDLPTADEVTIQSISTGAVQSATDLEVPPPRPPPAPRMRCYIMCIPPRLDFVNFTVGQLHTSSLRLVNVTKYEVRLSIRPPHRKELDLELCGARGLCVTSGAAAELKVHFRPKDVRKLEDKLLVRVSLGKNFVVPIACYIEPPLLDIMLPLLSLSVSSGDSDTLMQGAAFMEPRSCGACVGPCTVGGDVLELGARLLGDIHSADLVLYCGAGHASFYVLSEDAWLNFTLDDVTSDGAALVGQFTWRPVGWRGGGAVRGTASAYTLVPGLHVCALRVLASSAAQRQLFLIADTLMFSTDHLSLKADDKVLDICDEEDEECQYYVTLGTAFPDGEMHANIQLINHSPIPYNYYWVVRRWGTCHCPEDNMDCESANALMPPVGGRIPARSVITVTVSVPCAPRSTGTHAAALMLVVKDIPHESFASGFHPKILKTEVIEENFPGIKSWSHNVSSLVMLQLEVRWTVVPVRFVLEPAVAHLPYSKRVSTIDIFLRASQLFGPHDVTAAWHGDKHIGLPCSAAPPAESHAAPHKTGPLMQHLLRLSPAMSLLPSIELHVRELPDNCVTAQIVSLEDDYSEQKTNTVISLRPTSRVCSMRPALQATTIMPPGGIYKGELVLANNTYRPMVYQVWSRTWLGPASSTGCCFNFTNAEPVSLAHGDSRVLKYENKLPELDGPVVWLVSQRGPTAPSSGIDARAALVTCRILAPDLILRFKSCSKQEQYFCECVGVDTGTHGRAGGTAVLRTSAAITVGSYLCCYLYVRNLSPLPTTVTWEPQIDGTEFLQISIKPNKFDIAGHSEISVQVRLEGVKVTDRRIFLLRAKATDAYHYKYLVVDAAVQGVEVICDLPLGDGDENEGYASIRGIQHMAPPMNAIQRCLKCCITPTDIFAIEDERRKKLRENVCNCHRRLVYIPPVKKPRPARKDSEACSIEIITEPPSLTLICPCDAISKPVIPEYREPYCLQFREVPVRTVREKHITLRNISALPARWTVTVRRWNRPHAKSLDGTSVDPWYVPPSSPGLVTQAWPRTGVLPPGGNAPCYIRVYADTWGAYVEQLLVQIQHLEPFVIDLWVEVVGPPLQIAIKKKDSYSDEPPTLWLSSSDPERVLRVKNTSKADVEVLAYVTKSHEYSQDVQPFRLYYRLFDVLPRDCACGEPELSYDGNNDNATDCTSFTTTLVEEMETGIELYLAPDFGLQDINFIQVEPSLLAVEQNTSKDFSVILKAHSLEEQTPCTVIIRALPIVPVGTYYCRPEPPPQWARVAPCPREGSLQLSTRCCVVRLCALALRGRNITRIRKHLNVQNTGNGHLQVLVTTSHPWQVVDLGDGTRLTDTQLEMSPLSSFEMCVEVTVTLKDATPAGEPCDPDEPPRKTASVPRYEPHCRTSTALNFYENHRLVQTLPLVLELEFPVVRLEPNYIDFGYVTDGYSKKTYFTVSHTSCMTSLELTVECPDDQFEFTPTVFILPPKASRRVYVLYKAKFSAALLTRSVRVRGGAAWCGASLPMFAQHTRDHTYAYQHVDPTDDPLLMP